MRISLVLPLLLGMAGHSSTVMAQSAGRAGNVYFVDGSGFGVYGSPGRSSSVFKISSASLQTGPALNWMVVGLFLTVLGNPKRKSRLVLAPLLTALSASGQSAFRATGAMTIGRESHSATLLNNGQVLIAGGRPTYNFDPNNFKTIATAELYDPARGTFIPTGSMITGRTQHAASLLPDGTVLIAGGYVIYDGYGNGSSLNTAEIYDPSTRTFRAAGSMIHDECFSRSVLLGNGKVLLVGGSHAELYDPTNGSFADAGPYANSFGACYSSASLLADGKVLIVRDEDTSEVYDPVTSSFSATGQPLAPNESATETLLLDGTVLLAGGSDSAGPSAGSALFDFSTQRFIPAARMSTSHASASATLLPDGAALIASGTVSGYLTTRATDLYDPVRGTFRTGPDMITARFYHSATLLNDGSVLIAGGGTDALNDTSLAEVYSPDVLKSAPVLLTISGGAAAILHGSTQQLVSSGNPAIAGEVLEVFGTGLADGGVIPPWVAIGGRMAEVLFFGNAPGFPGLNQINVRVPSGLAPGLALSVRMNYLSRPSNEVTIGVQ